MDIKELTPQEKNVLLAQLKAEEKAKQEQVKEQKQQYKAIVATTVDECITRLERIGAYLGTAKAYVFKEFQTALDMKAELFGIKTGQMSHTFTNEAGTAQITIGFRQLDRYDDTANEGIAMVREALDALATNPDTKRLVNMVNSLLKRDKQGNLKANRIVELHNLSKEMDDERFKQGVETIMEAHRPLRSSYFIEARTTDENGVWNSLPLNISSADFLPVEYEPKMDTYNANN